MKAVYVQKGDTLDYINPTDTVIEAGTAIKMGMIFGVAATDIAPGERGTIATTGVWELPKDASAISAGENVIYDEEKDLISAMTVSEPAAVVEGEQGSSDPQEVVAEDISFIGVAIADAAVTDSTVLVKLY